jgi:hypothetical protein
VRVRAKLLALGCWVAIAACGKDEPAPIAPYVPDCERNHTAVLRFRNDSTVTHVVWIDGVVAVPSLSPGQESGPVTVAAGVQHDVEFENAATGATVCFASPVPAQCSDKGIACSFP